MNENTRDPVDELEQLLQEMEQLAPARADTAGTEIAYRPTADEEVVEDSLPSEEVVEDDGAEPAGAAELETIQALDFQTAESGAVAAVDCGVVRLGETENGLVIALRAAIIVDQTGGEKVTLFRTGPIYLHNAYKARLLHQIGVHMGRPDFFVELDESDVANPRPTRVKRLVADDSHQYGDRFRNWLERLVQKIAVASIESGVVLFDGALTLRTYDTPSTYLEDLASTANSRGNAIIAISKQSRLEIQGKPLRFWLNDVPDQACYRPLGQQLVPEGRERVLGNAYAARFSSLGPTFRMDVKAAEGQSDSEAIAQFHASAFMRGGYPDILVRAHAHCYFSSCSVVVLQAQAGAKYSLVPQGETDLAGIFAPFGGRFK